MASSTGFLDIINPWNWSSKRRITGNDDSFVDALRLYPDLWRELFVSSNIICCPISGSLKDEVTKDQLLSHVLVQQRTEGEYQTLRGEHVQLSGSDLIFDNNVDEPRAVKITSISEITDSNEKTAIIFRISRPLVGGIVAPEDSDQISIQAIFKYLTVLRSFPEAESTFMALDDYIKEINFVGSKSLDGFSRIKPSLTISLRLQWKRATDKLCRCKNLVATLGNPIDVSRRLIGQIVESYLMHSVAGTVYPWICVCNAEKDKGIFNYMQTLRYHTQSDLGIASTLQCNQSEAIKRLSALRSADTPVGKLIVLKRVVQHIRTAIERNIRKKFPSDDIELATDDIVLLIIWCLLQLSLSPSNSCTPGCFLDPLETEKDKEKENSTDRTFLSDLNFAMDFHFNASSTSELGFTSCHFQVASDWLTSRARAFSLQKTTAKLDINIDIGIHSIVSTAGRTITDLSALDSRFVYMDVVNVDDAKNVPHVDVPTRNVLHPPGVIACDTMEESKYRDSRDDIMRDSIQSSSSNSSSSNSSNGADVIPLRNGIMITTTTSSTTSSSIPIQKHGTDGLNGTESSSQNLGFEYFDGSCIIATEHNLDWIADIRKQQQQQQQQQLQQQQQQQQQQQHRILSNLRDESHLRGGVCTPHGTTCGLLGRAIHVLGTDLNSSPHTQPTIVTIKSNRTNKVGGVVMVAGSCGAYASVNEDGNAFTWGVTDSGRLGRGTYIFSTFNRHVQNTNHCTQHTTQQLSI